MNWQLNTGWPQPFAKTQEQWDAMTDRAAIIEECRVIAEEILRSDRYRCRSTAWGYEEIAERFIALAAVPPARTDRAVIIEALKREEDYLIRMCGSEADIMPGDIEGAFHRLAGALAAAPPAPPSSERQPTEAMLIAARDWSAKAFGKPIGNDAATGCWQAMFDARPSPPSIPERDKLLEALKEARSCIGDGACQTKGRDAVYAKLESAIAALEGK